MRKAENSGQSKANLKSRLRLPTRLTRVSWRDLAVVGLPMLLVMAAAFAIAGRFIQPAPPTKIVMTAGADASVFRIYADRYRKILARSGITLEILSSGGSVENLKRLSDPKVDVDVGFVQGGLPAELRSDDLVSLGAVAYEPLFVLYRSAAPIERLSQLAGKRVAIGREGSGGEALALALLKANDIEPGGATKLLPLNDEAAMTAMLEHRVDAVFLTGDSARPDQIRRLLHTPGLRMFDFVQAEGYLRRFRYLSRIDLPMGVLDLGRDLPAHSATLVGPTVELVARSELHPALVDLLIEAAREVHGHGSLLVRPGEFPSIEERDFPISDEAARYYKSGKSLVYRVLPFWLASLVNRTVVLLVPVVVLLLPALRLLPAMYRWRIRARIFRRYGQLMTLERESQQMQAPEEARRMLERLDLIERAVINLKLPGQFADEAYVLRQHIDFVRSRLGAMTAPQSPK
jgi:hypothetical protein